MEAHAVAGPDHHLTAHGPDRPHVLIAALSQVQHRTLALGVHQTHLHAPAIAVDKIDQQMAAIGRPVKPLVTVGIGIGGAARHDHARLATGQVQHFQGVAVFQIGHFLAIGRVAGLEVVLRVAQHRARLELRGGEEVRHVLLAAHQSRLDQAPHATAFRRINQAAAIRAEADRALLPGGVGDAPSIAKFGGGHKHLAPHHKGHFLAVWAQGHFGRALAQSQRLFGAGLGVRRNAQRQLGGLRRAGCQGVDLSVKPKAQRAIAGNAQRAYRVLAELGDLHRRVGLRNRHLPDVEGAALFAQEVNRLFIGRPNRVAVFTTKAGELLVLAGLQVISPNISGHG